MVKVCTLRKRASCFAISDEPEAADTVRTIEKGPLMSLSPDAVKYSDQLFESQQRSLLKERDGCRAAVRQNLSDIDSAARLAGYPGVHQPDVDFAVALSLAKMDALCRAYEWDGKPLTENVVGTIENEAAMVLHQSLGGVLATEKGRIASKARRTRTSDLQETEKIRSLERHVDRTISETRKTIHSDLILRMLEAKKAGRSKQEMANKRKQSITVGDAAQKILSELLAEFKHRNLGTEQLQHTYEGLSPAELRSMCCQDGRFSTVDFDLAMKELNVAELVKTGPMKPFENPPHSLVAVFALFSENKYSYLTEEGYKLAVKLSAPKSPRAPAQRVHISGGTFHQSPIGIGGHVSQTLNVSESRIYNLLREEAEARVTDENQRAEIVTHIDALESAPDQLSKIERYNKLVASIADHVTIFGPLLSTLLPMLIK